MFGGPQCPEIEIIRTGREKRKSENVSECAYADPTPHLHPIFFQSLHPSLLYCLLSVLICGAAAGSQADVGWRLMCACGLYWVAILRRSRARQSDQAQITARTLGC